MCTHYQKWVDPYGRPGWRPVNTKRKMRTAWGAVHSKEVTCNKPNQNHYFHRADNKRKAILTRTRSLPQLK